MSTIPCIGGTEVLGDWRPTRTEISDISCRERLAHEAVTKLFCDAAKRLATEVRYTPVALANQAKIFACKLPSLPVPFV